MTNIATACRNLATPATRRFIVVPWACIAAAVNSWRRAISASRAPGYIGNIGGLLVSAHGTIPDRSFDVKILGMEKHNVKLVDIKRFCRLRCDDRHGNPTAPGRDRRRR